MYISSKIYVHLHSNIMNTYGRYPLAISHGSGCYLYDLEGNRYLDMAAGIATCCLGNFHKNISIIRKFIQINCKVTLILALLPQYPSKCCKSITAATSTIFPFKVN